MILKIFGHEYRRGCSLPILLSWPLTPSMLFSSLSPENVSSHDSNPNRVAELAVFATTRWSLVLAAGGGSSADSEQALAHLCRTYWYPLYAFVRRQGRSPEDAEDLTQGFFAYLLEKETLRGVGKDKGKFRSFLLASLKNFLANDWDRKHAVKRGGHF